MINKVIKTGSLLSHRKKKQVALNIYIQTIHETRKQPPLRPCQL